MNETITAIHEKLQVEGSSSDTQLTYAAIARALGLDIDERAGSEAILRQLQAHFGIEVTGRLNQKTSDKLAEAFEVGKSEAPRYTGPEVSPDFVEKVAAAIAMPTTENISAAAVALGLPTVQEMTDKVNALRQVASEAIAEDSNPQPETSETPGESQESAQNENAAADDDAPKKKAGRPRKVTETDNP